MNDRFKFRIWDKKLKKLAEWGNNPYHNMEIMNYICVENPVTNWKHEDYILMQSTGLKDRNKKDVYENDIVEFTHSTNIKCRGVIKFLKEDAMFAVVYKHPESNKKDWDFMSKFTLNVIGNIYTAPELLEGKE